MILAACQQQATPFPVDVVLDTTPTAQAPETPAAIGQTTIHYALDKNANGFAADLENLPPSIQLEQLETSVNPADLDARFDLMAAYGLWPDATPSPVLSRVVLVINPIAPLDNPALVRVIETGLDMNALDRELNLAGMEIAPLEQQGINQLRQELANQGWPDGFDLTLAHELIPGYQQISEQLARLNIHTRQIPYTADTTRTNLLLVTWQTSDERDIWARYFGDETILVDLYSLPISYWASPDLPLTFSKLGWPLPVIEN